MKRFLCLPIILAVTASAFGQQKGLDDARQRWLHGNYEEAREIYQKVLKDPKDGTAAAIGLSRVLQSQGEYDEALKIVEEAVKPGKPPAELSARQAELLYFL